MRFATTVKGGLAFGLLAAAGAPLAIGLGVEVLLPEEAAGLYLILTAVTYLAYVAPTPRRAVGAAALAAVLGLVSLGVTASLTQAAVASALIVGAVRGALLYRWRSPREIVLEAGVVTGGFGLGLVLGGGTPLGLALSIWCFFLVQSVYFAARGLGKLGGLSWRGRDADGRDAFDVAQARLLDLLGDEA